MVIGYKTAKLIEDLISNEEMTNNEIIMPVCDPRG
jgi:hypothetical protein